MHKKGIEHFHVGEVGNRFLKGDIDQNVILDTKVQNVGLNISTSKHCTNFPHMEKLEHAWVMSEMSTVIFHIARTLSTQRSSG